MDEYTEVSQQGCLQRMMGAIFGVLIGFLMVIGSMVLLFWNEGRAVHRAEALAEGKGSVITIDASRVEPSNDGKLVHLTAEAVTNDTVDDQVFGVHEKALRLRRKVEMYQWKETVHSRTKKKTGGGSTTVKTYKYRKGWYDHLISSSSFRHRSGHENPSTMPFHSQEDMASPITVGAFTLPDSLASKIDSWEELSPERAGRLPSGTRVEGSYIFKGSGSVDSPVVGDARVSFQVVRPTTVSFYAKQTGDTFDTYYTSNDEPLLRLQVGRYSAQELFEAAETENTLMTWALRLIGFFLAWFGLMAIFKPFSVAADVIPFIGDLVETGFAIAAFAIAAPITLFTIAVGWIVYRPLLGILLMGAGLAIFALLFKWAAGRKASKAGAMPPPIPGS